MSILFIALALLCAEPANSSQSTTTDSLVFDIPKPEIGLKPITAEKLDEIIAALKEYESQFQSVIINGREQHARGIPYTKGSTTQRPTVSNSLKEELTSEFELEYRQPEYVLKEWPVDSPNKGTLEFSNDVSHGDLNFSRQRAWVWEYGKPMASFYPFEATGIQLQGTPSLSLTSLMRLSAGQIYERGETELDGRRVIILQVGPNLPASVQAITEYDDKTLYFFWLCPELHYMPLLQARLHPFIRIPAELIYCTELRPTLDKTRTTPPLNPRLIRRIGAVEATRITVDSIETNADLDKQTFDPMIPNDFSALAEFSHHSLSVDHRIQKPFSVTHALDLGREMQRKSEEAVRKSSKTMAVPVAVRDAAAKRPVPEGIEILPKHVEVDAKQFPDRNTDVEFTLVNNSPQPIHLARIWASCRLPIKGDPGRKEILPGESVAIKVQVPLSSTGHIERYVNFVIDEADVPVRRAFVLWGKHRYDFVERVPDIPPFIGAESRHAPREFHLKSIEPAGSKPYIERLECKELPITIALLSTSDQPSYEGAVERTYHCRLTWNDDSAWSDFHYPLKAILSRGDVREHSLGSLSGWSLQAPDPAQPSTFLLSKTDCRAREMLFDLGRSKAKWSVDPDFRSPDWLVLEWTTKNDIPLLEVKPQCDLLPASHTKLAIPLVCDDGRKTTVDVVVAGKP